MKPYLHVRTYIVPCLILLLFSGCAKKDEESDVKPLVSTLPPRDITLNSTLSGGYIMADHIDATVTVNERGICYSEMHRPPTIGDHVVKAGSGEGSFDCTISGLSPGTKYFICAFALNSSGVYYGNVLDFETYSSSDTLPDVGNIAIEDITSTSAWLGGYIIWEGMAPVTIRGVCWGLSHNPGLSDFYRIEYTGGTGDFRYLITGLTPSTQYFVRAFATNKYGTAFSHEQSFTTD